MPPKDVPEHPADPMEAALAEFHRACTSGKRPDLDTFCEEHSECGPELREKIEDLAFVMAGLPGSESTRQKSPETEERPEWIAHFRILKKLGRGGQGTVYLAEDEKLHRPVAIKVLPSGFDLTQHHLERFKREAEAASRLDHPGICSVYETGELEGLHYIVMRYVEGESLAKKITSARGVPSRFNVDVFDTSSNKETPDAVKASSSTGSSTSRQDGVMQCMYCIERAALAVHEAHEAGIVHRDIKPGNIMVTPDGDPVILDFGLARLEESDGADLTRSTDILGTPAYMSPEQIRGDRKRIKRQTDIYSLAATLVECLTLRPPFESPTREGLYRVILTEAPLDPRSLNPRIPSDLSVILQTALAKHPDHRYKTALDFAEELRRVRQREPILTRRAGPLLRLTRWSQRNPKLALATGGILFLLVLGLAVTTYFLVETKSSLRKIKELSDIRLLPFLEQWEKDLWPALPHKIQEMNRWLLEAEGLSKRREVYKEKLQTMQTKVSSTHDSESQREIETLSAFLEKLTVFNTLIEEVRARWRFASTVQKETVDKFSKEWGETITDIMDEEKNPHYRGLKIEPIIGLIPVGMDPSSKLYEFAHLQTGSIPLRDPVTKRLEVTEETGLIFILLPGGSFRMGAVQPGPGRPKGSPNVDVNCDPIEEGPDHEVKLQPFFLSKFEMTQGQWQHITGENPSNYFAGDRGCTLRNPVESIGWYESEHVLHRLEMVLPTEAQWEYACRAGTTTVWYTGDDPRSLDGFENLADEGSIEKRGYPEGWSCEEWLDDGYAFHAEVGRFAANLFGLHDMAGNVSEWTRSTYSRYGIHDIIGDNGERLVPDEWQWKSLRIYRGGNFFHIASYGRSAIRPAMSKQIRWRVFGLRPAIQNFHFVLAKKHTESIPTDGEVIRSTRIRANLLSNEGKYSEAEPLYRQVLECQTLLYGEEYLDTLSTMCSLAEVLQHKGDYAEADILYQKALDIWMQAFGEKHLKTQEIVHGLINLFDAWGKPEKAAEYRAMLGHKSDESLPDEDSEE